MKAPFWFELLRRLLCFCTLFPPARVAAFGVTRLRNLFLMALLAVWIPAVAQSGQPAITEIRVEGTNLVVTADIPAGFYRVTLESRARFGVGNWAPVAVTQASGTAGTA